MTQYVMGVDGGGSTVRVVIAGPDRVPMGEAQSTTVNPGVVGRDAATQTIRAAMRAALGNANLAPGQIGAVALGIAGAAAHHSARWLREVALAVTPDAHIVPSADFEIALVGALGERRGVLLLAGTGSLAYGVNAAGETALVGGWGYLLDDAGSGYWLGIEALRAVIRAGDGRGPQTELSPRMLRTLALDKALDLVPWLYHTDAARTRDIAAFAPLVLDTADAGDAVAAAIVDRARDELVLAVQTVIHRLVLDAPGIAFAGGLITTPNRLSQGVCTALGLSTIPQPRYSPVMGAVLLAQLALEAGNSRA